ncbi:MAG: hypothetical protein WA728_37440 [Xanthobacteraceae bacterium]
MSPRKAPKAAARNRDPRKGDLLVGGKIDRNTASDPPTKVRPAGIPSAHAPGALAVTDGTEFVGSIVAADGSWFAFDRAGVLLGEFRAQRAAMRIIPKAGGTQ